MKDTKGVRQVLEELVIKCGGILDNPIDHQEKQSLAKVEATLQEIMLGMLPERHSEFDINRSSNANYDRKIAENKVIDQIEQNIRGGFRSE